MVRFVRSMLAVGGESLVSLDSSVHLKGERRREHREGRVKECSSSTPFLPSSSNLPHLIARLRFSPSQWYSSPRTDQIQDLERNGSFEFSVLSAASSSLVSRSLILPLSFFPPSGPRQNLIALFFGCMSTASTIPGLLSLVDSSPLDSALLEHRLWPPPSFSLDKPRFSTSPVQARTERDPSKECF